MDFVSLVITYLGNNIWGFTDDTMPPGSYNLNDSNSAIVEGDLVTFKTKTGFIRYNRIPYTIITYVDSTDSGNNFTPTSAEGLVVQLAGIGFFGSGSGTGDPTTFLELTDVFLANYFGRAGQSVVVNDAETGLTTITIPLIENSTDLLDMPSTLIANRYLRVNPSGTGYILSVINPTAPNYLQFGDREIAAKGYQWISGVRTANTQNLEQVGDVIRGWVTDVEEDSPWYWMNAGRYIGGAPSIRANYQYDSVELLAFPTDPDYVT